MNLNDFYKQFPNKKPKLSINHQLSIDDFDKLFQFKCIINKSMEIYDGYLKNDLILNSILYLEEYNCSIKFFIINSNFNETFKNEYCKNINDEKFNNFIHLINEIKDHIYIKMYENMYFIFLNNKKIDNTTLYSCINTIKNELN